MEHDKKKPKISSDNELINEARKYANTNTNANAYSKSTAIDSERRKNDLLIETTYNTDTSIVDNNTKDVNGSEERSIQPNVKLPSTDHIDTHSVIIRCKEMRDAYHVDMGNR